MKFKPCLVALSFLALSPFSSFASPDPKATPDPKMEAFIKASTPGAEHQMLAKYAGQWDHTVSWWMDANAKPEVSKGSSEIAMIMGGRFLEHKVSGTSMGQPFSGLGITGYDNVQKHFSTIWLDNMGTGMMNGKANFDKDKNALVDQGSFSCPMSQTGTKEYRAVWTMPANNTFKYEMYVTDDSGKEFKMMQIDYVKAK